MTDERVKDIIDGIIGDVIEEMLVFGEADIEEHRDGLLEELDDDDYQIVKGTTYEFYKNLATAYIKKHGETKDE